MERDVVSILSEISILKERFDKEMPEVISTGDTTKALGIKSEIERRINAVQELLLPPGTFTKEQREALENRGYVIYRLTGQSIASERDKSNKFHSDWHKEHPDFENKISRLTEVAFNPDPEMFFLPGSNNKTLFQQEEMVELYSQDLQREIKGVKAVIGEAPDYIELAFGYTGKYSPLFGEPYNYRYTRTKTEAGPIVVDVGNLSPDVGLLIGRWRADRGHGALGVAPLVVPDK